MARPRFRFQFQKPETPGPYIVAGLVVIGIMWTFFYFRGPTVEVPSKEEVLARTATVDEPPILDLAFDSVTGVTIERPDAVYAIEQGPNGWRVEQPVRDMADAQSVADFVSFVANIRADEVVESPEPEVLASLSAPVFKATFDTADGDQVMFTVGQPEGVVEHFVRTSESSDIHLVRNFPDLAFALTEADFVKHELFEFDPAEAVRITATFGNDTLEMFREGGVWKTQQDGESLIVFGVPFFLRDLRFFSAPTIAALGSASPWPQLGLAPSGETIHVTVDLADGRSLSLDVGSRAEDGRRFFVRSSARPHAYAAVEFRANNLISKLQEATPYLLNIDPARVVGLEIGSATADSRVVGRRFQLRDNTWTTEQDGAVRRVAFNVPAFIEAIVDLRAFQQATGSDATAYGFQPTGWMTEILNRPDTSPTTTIASRQRTLEASPSIAPSQGSLQVNITLDNNAVYTVDIGGPTPDGRLVHVRTSNRDGVYLTSTGVSQAITTAFASIRTDLMPVELATVERLRITSVEGGAENVVDIVRPADGWDEDAVALIEGLQGLQAESIASPDDEPLYGFYPADDSLRIEVHSTDGSTVVFDRGGAKQEGSGWFALTNYFVRVSGLSEVVMIGDSEASSIDRLVSTARP